jgi:hypothetical protein
VEGVDREQDAGDVQIRDHLLHRGRFVAGPVEFGVRQDERVVRGKGAQGRSGGLLVELIEAAFDLS